MSYREESWREPLFLSHSIVFILSCLLLITVSYQWGLNAAATQYYSPEEEKPTAMETYFAFKKPVRKTQLASNKKPGQHKEMQKDAMVEFSVSGHYVKFHDVFDPEFPWTPVEDVDFESMEQKEKSDIQAGKYTREEVKLFIAVTTAVCSETDRKRRQGIRETWMKDGIDSEHLVTVKFFVGNQVNCSARMMKRMEHEMRDHNDIVVLRGDDSYNGLSNKTLGMMQYVLSQQARYTHMMKADDDIYVRVSKLVGTVTAYPYGSYMEYVYKGCMANPNGFEMVRDPASKWYFSYDEISAETQQKVEGTGYVPGWSYLVSRDNVFHAMKKVRYWEYNPAEAPQWHKRMKGIEDAMMGIMLSDRMDHPDYDERFKPTWKDCSPDTAVVHLDVDSPALLKSLHEQDRIGLWDTKSVHCSLGNFTPGDMWGWLDWRNSITKDGEKFI